MAADRNLLFGILAVQMDFITRDQLVAAMNAWVLDKGKPLGQVLVEQGALPAGKRQLLEPLVDQHVRDHSDDPQKSLASLSSASSISRMLQVIPDSDVQASLDCVGRARAADPTNPTTLDYDPAARYRILRPHAKGGLGEVYVAEDAELHREVALKEIQPAKDRPDNRTRFLLEAEITGGLEHPGIVPVYGLGHHDDGRPYYAMRFIKGDNLGEAIKRFHAGTPDFSSLEFRRLLQRFIDVCNAIAYAHSRGVLHRDLKPGNIMLGKYGETLVVDWGLAKTQTSRERERPATDEPTLIPASGSNASPTIHGLAIGTPAYMSPEQAEGKLDLLGPASDVYSLGATLYHLLVGQPPNAGCDVISVLAKAQRGEFDAPRKVQPAIPRPLEAICLKAMSLKLSDRYPTAQALAGDVEHWLADEPVAAFAEPLSARAKRWARKHPGPVASLAASLIVGIVGLGAGLYFVNAERQQTEIARHGEQEQRQEAQKQRDDANSQRTEAQKQRDEAQRQRDETEAVLKFVEDKVFAAARPENQAGGLGKNVTLERAVEASLPFVANGFKDRPLTEARLRMTMGTSFSYLGRADIAEGQYRRARELYTAHSGPDHPGTLKSMNNLANSYVDLGRHAEALALREETLKLQKAMLGPDHPDTLASMNNLALSYADFGRLLDALSLREETLKLQKAMLGPDHPITLTNMHNLANSYAALGRLPEALALHEETLGSERPSSAPTTPTRSAA
ncbi:MAG: tetratricopeptide repeat protein [Gemmataceae bacterium]|nr:tetratricopeptide repeat protein [Gemmataceae bacterium]